MSINPKKSLGQNFLVNKGVIQKILDAAEIKKDDVVLEIGPGEGVLTKELAEKASRVIAIEKDRRLVNFLRSTFPESSNIEIIEADALKFNPYSIFHIPYKIVANIPYYITSHFLKMVFENWPMPQLIVLMVQKEVAQRITVVRPPYNLLALSVQFFAEPKIISYVSRGSFRPIPKVDSAIIRLVPKNEKWNTPTRSGRGADRSVGLEYGIKDKFFKLIKTAFAGKRKQLKNTIGSEILKKAEIKPNSRPEELSLEDWLRVASMI